MTTRRVFTMNGTNGTEVAKSKDLIQGKCI